MPEPDARWECGRWLWFHPSRCRDGVLELTGSHLNPEPSPGASSSAYTIGLVHDVPHHIQIMLTIPTSGESSFSELELRLRNTLFVNRRVPSVRQPRSAQRICIPIALFLCLVRKPGHNVCNREVWFK